MKTQEFSSDKEDKLKVKMYTKEESKAVLHKKLKDGWMMLLGNPLMLVDIEANVYKDDGKHFSVFLFPDCSIGAICFKNAKLKEYLHIKDMEKTYCLMFKKYEQVKGRIGVPYTTVAIKPDVDTDIAINHILDNVLDAFDAQEDVMYQ